MKNLGTKTCVYPMPVFIIGTYDEFGKANAMNAAWGGIYDYEKVAVSLGEHKTTDNLKITNAFTIGIADSKNVKECDYVGIVSGNKVKDKIEKTGWDVIKSEFVNAPIFTNLPITLECVVDSFNDGILVGKIINVCCREDILGSDGLPDLTKFSPITFDPFHNKYVELGKTVGDAFKIGKEVK